MHGRRLTGLAAAVLGAGAAPPASTAPVDVFRPAESADALLVKESGSWDRHLHDALGLPAWLDLAVEQRTRFEHLAGPFRPGEPGSQTQYPQRTRLRLGVDGPGPLRFLAELQDARTHADGPRDFTGGEIDEIDVLQLFLAATGRDLLGTGLRGDVHVGRLTLDVASRRLVARNSFRNTTNAFDGLHVQVGDGAAWRVRAFATRPVVIEPGPFDDESGSGQRFWGVAWEDTRLGWLNLDAFYLGLKDRTGGRDYTTLGARGFRAPRARQLDWEVELMGQLGKRGARDQRAFAGHAELGFTFAAPSSPRLAAQLDYASGSAAPDGGESGTFDPLFGARRFDLDPTGIYGPFRRSNIVSPGLRLVVSPLPKLKAQLKVRHWELAQARDAFAGTGLQDPTGRAGRNLGQDVELQVQWTPLAWLVLDAGYDHWFKGSYLERVPGAPSSRDSDYVYVSTQVRF